VLDRHALARVLEDVEVAYHLVHALGSGAHVEQLDREATESFAGLAWLELRVGEDARGTTYSQRAVFQPRGLGGHAYWRAVAPFHGLVFGAMARNIARAARTMSGGGQTVP